MPTPARDRSVGRSRVRWPRCSSSMHARHETLSRVHGRSPGRSVRRTCPSKRSGMNPSDRSKQEVAPHRVPEAMGRSRRPQGAGRCRPRGASWCTRLGVHAAPGRPESRAAVAPGAVLCHRHFEENDRAVGDVPSASGVGAFPPYGHAASRSREVFGAQHGWSNANTSGVHAGVLNGWCGNAKTALAGLFGNNWPCAFGAFRVRREVSKKGHFFLARSRPVAILPSLNGGW
ncbi:hypothetical protein FTUN_8466 [Frigoriglobus tundricola]|uniref:Uncharacterized protein n=1 Tax=Frigoriglobus tundricola TaxID=2774151 RepID=A0A6M5Z335_9BACT|nr:hypothetical protein FTUN_8466 [Frigoriglobus tundricola]